MYDIVLSGGIVVDGTRTKPYTADIGIKDGRIALINSPNTLNGAKVIDVSGKIVSPGFIDIHTHSDICPLLPKPFYPLSSLYQGVTTQIGGNCGISIVPCYGEFKKETLEYFKSSVAMENDDYTFDLESISDYSNSIKKNPFISNIGIIIGHSALRGCIMGFGDRNPTAEELTKLENLLDRELTRGALGISLGLIYPPSAFSTKDELVALSKIVAKHNGILSVHMRNEGKYVFESVKEMLEIAKLSGVHLQLSHLKLIGKSQWGAAKKLLKLINDARDNGINVTCDQYPYHATSTLLNVLVPKWAHDGGNEALIKNLHEKSQKLIDDIAEEMENRGGGNCVKVVSTQGNATELDGKTIEEIAEIRNTTEIDAVIDMLIMCNGSTKAIYFSLYEDDVIEILKYMNIAIGSDGYALMLVIGVFSKTNLPNCFKLLSKGMATMSGTFFLFILMNVMLVYINYGGGFDALGNLFLSYVSETSRALVVILGTLVGSFGINGGAVAQLQVTHDLFASAVATTKVPIEVWAIALICGSRVTSSIYPGSNMIAPMGLARSESIKAMLFGGWAVSMVSILFIILWALVGMPIFFPT